MWCDSLILNVFLCGVKEGALVRDERLRTWSVICSVVLNAFTSLVSL